jgi:hypothetical protein
MPPFFIFEKRNMPIWMLWHCVIREKSLLRLFILVLPSIHFLVFIVSKKNSTLINDIDKNKLSQTSRVTYYDSSFHGESSNICIALSILENITINDQSSRNLT